MDPKAALTLESIRRLKKGTKEQAMGLLMAKDQYLQRLSSVLESVFEKLRMTTSFHNEVTASIITAAEAAKECLANPWRSVARRREALIYLQHILDFATAGEEQKLEEETTDDRGEGQVAEAEHEVGLEDVGLHDTDDGVREISTDCSSKQGEPAASGIPE